MKVGSGGIRGQRSPVKMLLGIEVVEPFLGTVGHLTGWTRAAPALFLHRLFIANKTFVKSTISRVVEDLSVPSFRWSLPFVDGSAKGEMANGLSGRLDAGPFAHSGSQGEVQGYSH